MIRFNLIIAALILLIASPALILAQEAQQPEEPAMPEPAAQAPQLQPPLFTVTSVANRPIVDSQGSQLGTVTDWFINSSGQITHAIVSLQNLPQLPSGEYVAPVHLLQVEQDSLVVADPVQPIDQVIAPLTGVKTAGIVALDSVRANELVDYELVDELGQSIGSIQDVVVDLENWQVVYTALNFGDVLGVVEKLFAVPLSDVWYHLDQETVTIFNLNPQAIQQNPGFETSDWPQDADPNWNRAGQQDPPQPQPQNEQQPAGDQEQQQ